MSKEIGSPPSEALFLKDEKVLCPHQQLIYECKVLAVKKQKYEDSDQEDIFYLIHYAGWSKKWDEFVPESRLLKHNEENLNRQKELLMQVGRKSTPGSAKSRSANRKSGTQGAGDTPRRMDLSRSSTPTAHDEDEPVSAAKNKKGSRAEKIPRNRKLQEPVTTEQIPADRLDEEEFHALIPEKIKQILKEDYDRINIRKMLPLIAARHSISNVLVGYLEHLERKGTPVPPVYATLVDIFQDNITYGLRTRLLYQPEQEHYQDITRGLEESTRQEGYAVNFDTNNLLSKIYGPYHLMRFCYNIPRIMNATCPAKYIPVKELKEFVRGLYGYVLSRFDELFIPDSDYVIPK